MLENIIMNSKNKGTKYLVDITKVDSKLINVKTKRTIKIGIKYFIN